MGTGDVLPLPGLGEQICRDCKKLLPLSDFSPNKDMRPGVVRICKPCNARKAMEWNDANRDKVFDARLRRDFGITSEQYQAMVTGQRGLCACCGNEPDIKIGRDTRRVQGRQQSPSLVVDHDHFTGQIRGLLCIPCNRGIGLLGDDAAGVRFALKYLEEAEARAPIQQSQPRRHRPRRLTDEDIAWIRSGPPGLTQRQMAEKLGVSPSVISRVKTRSRGRR